MHRCVCRPWRAGTVSPPHHAWDNDIISRLRHVARPSAGKGPAPTCPGVQRKDLSGAGKGPQSRLSLLEAPGRRGTAEGCGSSLLPSFGHLLRPWSVLYDLLPALHNPWLLNISRMPGSESRCRARHPSIWNLLERVLRPGRGVWRGVSAEGSQAHKTLELEETLGGQGRGRR